MIKANMKNIYYSIWVDAIVNIERNPKHRKDWKFFTMFYMTLLNALNFGVILMLLGYFLKINVIWIRIMIFPGTLLNSFVSFIIQFAFPFILLNYIMIFAGDRYNGLIKKYSDKKGKLFAAYLVSSIGAFILVLSPICGYINKTLWHIFLVFA
jgi:hypothetical protein